MWPTIDRARRRINGGSAAPVEPSAEPPRPETIDDVIVLATPELGRLGHALRIELDQVVERPDTPARIEGALSMLIAGRGGLGRPRVLRRPAALSAPEAWEIHLDGVDRETSEAVRDASRTGSFER